ncbi:MAG: tryptophan-rich sensory protein [Anaerolineales bacterium]|nr:tryptophan-rich sensory protein [Anaerolineales bacterium]
MNRDVLRQVINVLAVVLTLTINGLANAIPLNGKTTGDISDQFDVYFVPAGYVFSIWGLIYIALIAFAIFQALPAQRENPRLRRIGYWFALSCAANVVWLFFWHYEIFVGTIIVMAVLLVSLIVIYLRLNIGRQRVSQVEKWCVNIPFSIYLGWISVATIANAADVLYYYNWNGLGITPQVWAVIMLMVGLALAAAMSFMRRDIPYQLVLVWAFIGIAVKQAGAPLVANAAWIMSGLVVMVLVAGVFMKKRAF